MEQPEGSTAKFIPSHDFPNPSFEVDLSGIYTFYLVVYDENNTPSCFPAEYEVAVIPDETIHIELFWHTPGDPDETDEGLEAGADLDLHLLHPLAAGPDLDGDGSAEGWFDIPWDCFWCNHNPDLGPEGPDGNPYIPVEDRGAAEDHAPLVQRLLAVPTAVMCPNIGQVRRGSFVSQTSGLTAAGPARRG